MTYIEKQLASGERVAFTTQRVFSPVTAIIVGLFGLALFLVGPVGIFFGCCMVLGVSIAWLSARTTEFAVTDRRVVIKIGALSVRTVEMNLDKIETVEVVQPWLRPHRTSGNVRIIGSGATSETFANVMRALEFRRAIQEARDARALTG